MIDFLKILIDDKKLIQEITNNPSIHKQNLERKVNANTGLIFDTYSFLYRKSIFIKWKEYKRKYPLEITIKPHYFFNSGRHNANDFSSTECIKILEHTLDWLGVNNGLKRLKIVNIEFGVNFTTTYKDDYCLNNILYHGTNAFYNHTNLAFSKVSYRPTQKGKANMHKQLKLYSKHKQFPNYSEENTLRFEIKSNRSKYINNLGIYTIEDLLKLETYERIKRELIKESEQLLFTQELKDKSNLTKRQRRELVKMNNPHYWQKTLKKDRSKFTRKKQQYFRYLDKTDHNLTKSITKRIKEKCAHLTVSKSGITSSSEKEVEVE